MLENLNFKGDMLSFCHLKWKRIPAVVVLAVALAGLAYGADIGAESDAFPSYPCIQPNVEFWTKIYTQYSSDYGVLHDSRRLDIIYDVIELADPDQPGGRKLNKKRIQKAKNEIKNILARLMRGAAPAGPDEQRVAALFGPEATAADFRSAMHRIRCQTGQKDRFQEGLIRSGAYIEEIKQIFSEAGLPEDLAYLPHVESSFNPKAYSKFGAAGMWQFTRSTGRRFMKVDYTIDERRDPILSSRAAAQLLGKNYEKLLSWPLAITAYNHGATGMLRAQRKKGSYDLIFKEYRSRIFKFASRNFYSEFLAAREAAKNYRQYFGDLDLDTPTMSSEIELAGYVSLPQLIEHLDLELDDLRELNPALRSPVFNGQKYVPGGYRLRVPDSEGRDWKELFAQLPPEIYRQDQKRSHIYTVRQGDTAGKIARQHGVDLDDLIAVNNLGRRAIIYVNQTLRIPLPEEKPVLVARIEKTRENAAEQKPEQIEGGDVQIAEADMSAGENDILLIKTPPQANQTAASLFAQNVLSKDSAESNLSTAQIEAVDEEPSDDDPEFSEDSADNDGDSAEADQKAVARQSEPDNNLKPDEDSANDRMSAQVQTPAQKPTEIADLPESELQGSGQDSAAPVDSRFVPVKRNADNRLLHPEILQGHFAVERVANLKGKPVGIIQVEAEETLGHYAEWLGVPAQQIRRLNGFRYGQPLHLSQQIKIPLSRVSKEEFEEKRFEFHQEMAEDFFSTYRVEKVLTYSVKRGDNIWKLTHQEFEVPLWLIKRFNADVDFGTLIPSQKLIIPVVEKNV